MRGDLRGGTGSGTHVGVGMGESVRVCPGVLPCVVRMCVRGMARIAWRVVWSTVVAGWFPVGARCWSVPVGAPSVGANVGSGIECTGSSAGASAVATLWMASRSVGKSADLVARGRFVIARMNSSNTVVVCCAGVSVGRQQCVG